MNGDYREKNLRLLREKYPALAARNFPPENSGPPLADEVPAALELTQTAVGVPGLRVNGVHIHSQRDPVREARRQTGALLPADGTAEKGGVTGGIVIVLGMGLGYGAEAALTLGLPLIIVEKRPEIFRLALKERDLEALLGTGKPIFILGGNSDSIQGALSLLEQTGERLKPWIMKNRALASASPADEAWYADVERRIQTWASRDEINLATLRRFGKRWTINLAANLQAVRDLPGVRGLEGILAAAGNAPDAAAGNAGAPAIPVFLAAAGPSLDALGPRLIEIRRRCLVIAVDTSLRFLREAGAEPDFTVAVDPQYWNARHLFRSGAGTCCLVAESAVYPPVLRDCLEPVPAGSFRRALLCQSLFPLGRYIEDRTDPKGTLGAGGSVATTAWDFARLLGPEEIWIGGLDLSFPGLKTHFKGALFEESAHAESDRLDPAETKSLRSLRGAYPFSAASASGGRVLTDKRLSLYAAWFENRFRGETIIRNYSLSGEGLAIPGLLGGSMDQLLALPPRREELDLRLEAAFQRIDGDFFAPQETSRRGERYAGALRSLLEGLQTMAETAEAAEKAARNGLGERGQGLLRPENAAPREKLLRKLDEANAAIAASPVKDAAGFLFPPPSELEAVLAAKEPAHTETEFTRFLKFSNLFYHSLGESIRFTLEKLRSGR